MTDNGEAHLLQFIWLSEIVSHCAQKYTIRDLTTGQLFVVDAEPLPQAEALSEPGSPVKEGRYSLIACCLLR